MLIAVDDIDWHDGILIDVQVSGLAQESQELRLILDLYSGKSADSGRKRYLCTGMSLARFLLSGDVVRLLRNRSAGNIDFMRLHTTADTEILVVCMFGGMIEAEAASFRLTEIPS
ncbi:hypothetical protein ACQR1W_11280 [Bradyrhizobium sp. HKCCYLS1011]|uniref:hypothetical protein n=1 Tax=Bradyrhizobium sp. HKCCYLS1011 TaxID=3420733 RepID=UPI003EB953E6